MIRKGDTQSLGIITGGRSVEVSSIARDLPGSKRVRIRGQFRPFLCLEVEEQELLEVSRYCHKDLQRDKENSEYVFWGWNDGYISLTHVPNSRFGEALFAVDDASRSRTDHGVSDRSVPGDPARFASSKALASYVGMIPGEYSSGKRQRLGGLTKQGNPLLRFLWSEAAIHAVRRDPELKHFYRRKLIQKGLGKARAAVARKLGIRMWIMLRDGIEYNEFCRRGQKQQKSGDACAGMPERRYGAKVTG